MPPVVSVLIPIYNGSRYLQKAIDSILAQTLTDFELIAVDDGSTDGSWAILQSYTDPRMRLLRNERNSGIVVTMNKGLDACRGRYIARMDADDIALPARLAAQVAWLEANPDCGVVDCVQACIDDADHPINAINSPVIDQRAIYRTLPKLNCLGHPSVMIRAGLLRQYRYRQIAYEDYDLWLRMAADGVLITKLPEPLLLFRVHTGSITGADHAATRHFEKIIRTKLFYISRLTFTQSLHPFNLRVRAWLLRDLAIHAFKKLKAMRKAR